VPIPPAAALRSLGRRRANSAEIRGNQSVPEGQHSPPCPDDPPQCACPNHEPISGCWSPVTGRAFLLVLCEKIHTSESISDGEAMRRHPARGTCKRVRCRTPSNVADDSPGACVCSGSLGAIHIGPGASIRPRCRRIRDGEVQFLQELELVGADAPAIDGSGSLASSRCSSPAAPECGFCPGI
jgi:hypothetical protein